MKPLLLIFIQQNIRNDSVYVDFPELRAYHGSILFVRDVHDVVERAGGYRQYVWLNYGRVARDIILEAMPIYDRAVMYSGIYKGELICKTEK